MGGDHVARQVVAILAAARGRHLEGRGLGLHHVVGVVVDLEGRLLDVLNLHVQLLGKLLKLLPGFRRQPRVPTLQARRCVHSQIQRLIQLGFHDSRFLKLNEVIIIVMEDRKNHVRRSLGRQ